MRFPPSVNIEIHYDWISSVQFSHSVMSNSLWPHGLQHSRLPWSFLKLMSIELVMWLNKRVFYWLKILIKRIHDRIFPLAHSCFHLFSTLVLIADACMFAKSLHSCLILCHPMDYSQPGSSAHGILQARIQEWVAMPFSRVSSQPRIKPVFLRSPALARRFFTTSTTWEAHRNIP